MTLTYMVAITDSSNLLVSLLVRPTEFLAYLIEGSDVLPTGKLGQPLVHVSHPTVYICAYCATFRFVFNVFQGATVAD